MILKQQIGRTKEGKTPVLLYFMYSKTTHTHINIYLVDTYKYPYVHLRDSGVRTT